MAEEVMDKPAENFNAMRNEMDHTRSSLACKLEALEDKVRSTVESTRHTVEDTVQAAKDSVNDTIATVKRTFDLKYQVVQRPWLMIGCAAFVGAVVAHITGPKKPRYGNGSSDSYRDEGYRHRPVSEFAGGSEQWRSSSSSSESSAAKPSWKSRMFGQFEDEICKLQSIAVGAGLGVIRDWVSKTMPSLSTHLERVFDSATSKLGGERIDGPVLRSGDETETT